MDDINKINYYINISISQNLSVRQLREKIKLNEYDRLDIVTKNKLIKNVENEVVDFVKNPIIIKSSVNMKLYQKKYFKN